MPKLPGPDLTYVTPTSLTSQHLAKRGHEMFVVLSLIIRCFSSGDLLAVSLADASSLSVNPINKSLFGKKGQRRV